MMPLLEPPFTKGIVMCRFFSCGKKKRLKSYKSPAVRHDEPRTNTSINDNATHARGNTVIDVKEALKSAPISLVIP